MRMSRHGDGACFQRTMRRHKRSGFWPAPPGTPPGDGNASQRAGNAADEKRPSKAVGKSRKRQDDAQGTTDENAAEYQFFHCASVLFELPAVKGSTPLPCRKGKGGAGD